MCDHLFSSVHKSSQPTHRFANVCLCSVELPHDCQFTSVNVFHFESVVLFTFHSCVCCPLSLSQFILYKNTGLLQTFGGGSSMIC